MVHYQYELRVSAETAGWLADNSGTLGERIAFVPQISKLGHDGAMREVLAEPILLITAWSALMSAMVGMDAPDEIRSETRSIGEALRRTAHLDRLPPHAREQLDDLLDELHGAGSVQAMAEVVRDAVDDSRLVPEVGGPLADHIADDDLHIDLDPQTDWDATTAAFCGAVGFAVGELPGSIAASIFGGLLAPRD